VLDEIKRAGTLSGDRAAEYLVGMAEVAPSVRNIPEYAALVADTARRADALNKTIALCEMLESEDMAACQDMAGEIIKSLSHTTVKDTWGAEEAFLEFYVSLKDPQTFLRTGFTALDKKARISPGDYVVVGGRPSSGKTALTLQIAAHMAKSHKVVYFSLETRTGKIMRRLSALMGGGTMDELLDHTPDWEKLYEAGERIKPLNMSIVESSGWTVGQIKAKSIQLGAEVVFIDYLGLISSKGNGLYEQTTNISRDLHIMAQQTGITVVALSQLKRGERAEPTMQDLRQSGQIEQDADIILLLHRNEEGDRRDVIVAKNKEGEVGKLPFTFSGPGQKFYPEERRY
jgi:replicative DNA helicase